jgi:hypothetical protein
MGGHGPLTEGVERLGCAVLEAEPEHVGERGPPDGILVTELHS